MHFVHIGFIEARTFISFKAVHDPSLGVVVAGHLNPNPVTRQDFDVIEAHFARKMSQNLSSVIEFDPKERIRETLQNRALNQCFVLFSVGKHL